MRLYRTALAVAGVLLLAGCTGLSACGTPAGKAVSAAISPTAIAGDTLRDEQALYAAEAAYYGLGAAAEAAVDAGLLKGARARQVLALEERAFEALEVARSAHLVGDAATVGERARAALALIGDAQRLVMAAKAFRPTVAPAPVTPS